MAYTRSTELCQIQFELDTLADKLEDDWRTLFYLIPRQIDDIDRPPGSYAIKYNGTQERELEDYGERQNISRARQLLEEWSTSGRKENRPRLGHLLTLLIKGNLFRAADYIARDMLKDNLPERPSCGPAAPIDIDRELDCELEKMLDGVTYPDSAALHNGMQSLTLEENLDRPEPPKREQVTVLGELIASGVSNSENNEQSNTGSAVMPMLSALLAPDAEAGPSGVAPVFSIVGNTLSSTSDSMSDTSSSASTSTSESRSAQMSTTLGTIAEDDGVPNLSIFGATSLHSNLSNGGDNPVPRFSAIFTSTQQQSSVSGSPQLPRFSIIGLSQEERGDISTVNNSNLIQFSSVNCPISSIANFPYSLLKTATANFDKRPFSKDKLEVAEGRLLGTGGFGEVFLGINLSADIALAAVKRLFPSNYKYREKYDREREILTKYSHPNIVRLFGYSEDNELCLVYEFLADGNLESALERSRRRQSLLTASSRIDYLLGIASAIEYLHSPQVQVIHRDITLANVLLDGASVAKLCDFGLVKRIDSMTATSVMGTGPYLAPESLRGTVTPAMDIYSFGVVLAAVGTGKEILVSVPGGEDLLELVTSEVTDPQALVDRAVRPEEVDSWLELGRCILDLAKRCLRERLQRPTARAVRERIGEIAVERPEHFSHNYSTNQ
ncbi:interleukin-1 receptor-associated kinase 4-like [Sabethes cyaneus]|uniref:interleukin-1 receptor-associated kinase 4-like n=1 Tax=Sabethes cyaneus TaxID=53552 RepID=UPI00237E84F1|nr:interleukin-1 receptor-associated kinase 4-like [Sabethes cyaneus]